MDVPLQVAVAVSLPIIADLIAEPGAKTSTQEPKLENEERASDEVDEATVSAALARAGE